MGDFVPLVQPRGHEAKALADGNIGAVVGEGYADVAVGDGEVVGCWWDWEGVKTEI